MGKYCYDCGTELVNESYIRCYFCNQEHRKEINKLNQTIVQLPKGENYDD